MITFEVKNTLHEWVSLPYFTSGTSIIVANILFMRLICQLSYIIMRIKRGK